MTRTHRTLAPLAALALSLAACGGDDPKPTTVKPAAKPESAMPYGTYTRTVTRRDIARTSKMRAAAKQEGGPDQELPRAGESRLVISKSEAGDIIDSIGSDGFKIGVYASAADGVLNIEDYVDPTKGSFCGPEVPAKATYRYEVDGNRLSIEASPPDPCADRDTVLAGTWDKQ
jgi:hypothetical protein